MGNQHDDGSVPNATTVAPRESRQSLTMMSSSWHLLRDAHSAAAAAAKKGSAMLQALKNGDKWSRRAASTHGHGIDGTQLFENRRSGKIRIARSAIAQ